MQYLSIEHLINSLSFYIERFPSEKQCADTIIVFLSKNKEKSFHNWYWDDGHITASMLIVNPEKTRVLLMFHKKLQKWLQFGGHSDDSSDVLSTAIREFHEESGIMDDPKIFSYFPVHILPIFDIDIHDIPADTKGRPNHKHYDIRFLGIIPDTVTIDMQRDEVDDIRWFDIDTVGDFITEIGTLRMIQKIKDIDIYQDIQ